ncbi:PAP2 superfamily protein [bacterium BMS3Bbin06]|nr:PAP2 superfamily protein [bacterium BMS3Abin08]GBE35751.1 PAP2 superfamily protein [bacterium BMS3Bbin06]HDO35556.1 phosphatase PAP2 family protein [Nitrospirota bacterium]HDY72201.1 phosphatase PAP2 family protein [Nitrospirota bacterium]
MYRKYLDTIRPADLTNLFFIGLFTLLTLFFYDSIESPDRLLITYFSLMLLQVLLIKLNPSGGLTGLFRDVIFPVISIFLVFDTMTELIPGINPHDIDYILIRMDFTLFGTYPTVWLERFNSPVLTDILQISYTSYYFLPIILGIVLKLKGRNKEFDTGLFFILLCFYLSYVGYILFPALGPRYVIDHLQTKPLEGNALSEWIYNTLNRIEGIKRDAFPSGHTAITLTVLHMAYRYEKRVLWIFLPPAIMLIIATVYCRYHYVVDVIGGVILYVITLILGNYILSKSTYKS